MTAAAGLYRGSAARLRETGGVGGKNVDRDAVNKYLAEVDLPKAIAGVRTEADSMGGLRGQYLAGMAMCFEVMWDLAMEILGKGPAVPYERCVKASTGQCARAFRPGAQARARGRAAGPRRLFTRMGCSQR